MANKVYANGREIACKAAAGKSIAVFPDVCLSPPSPPAGPVPIPYPNTALASDASQGSKTVQISGQEVMLKDQSFFSKSSGDEAATKSLGMGVVTHQIQGKAYFTSWSMNVKIEGENVDRHLDLTTHNHASFPGNTPPWAYIDSAASGGSGEAQAIGPCAGEAEAVRTACRGKNTHKAQCADPDCRESKRCLLVTQNQGKRKTKNTIVGCCKGYQAHHLVEAHCFYHADERGNPDKLFVKTVEGKRAYRDVDAPCVCVKGPRHQYQHGQYHAYQQGIEAAHAEKKTEWTYAEARECGVQAHALFNPQCTPECTAAQLNAYHTAQCGLDDKTKLRLDPGAWTRPRGKLTKGQSVALETAVEALKSEMRAAGQIATETVL